MVTIYMQEAEHMRQVIYNQVQWHMIGHLQRNKVRKAVRLFNMIETINSVALAEVVNKLCNADNKIEIYQRIILTEQV